MFLATTVVSRAASLSDGFSVVPLAGFTIRSVRKLNAGVLIETSSMLENAKLPKFGLR